VTPFLTDSLHAVDYRDPMTLREITHRLERAPLRFAIPWDRLEILAAQTGQVGLRETHDLGALLRGLRQQALDALEPIVEGRRHAGRGQADDHACAPMRLLGK
jgi:hypothetical protein